MYLNSVRFPNDMKCPENTEKCVWAYKLLPDTYSIMSRDIVILLRQSLHPCELFPPVDRIVVMTLVLHQHVKLCTIILVSAQSDVMKPLVFQGHIGSIANMAFCTCKVGLVWLVKNRLKLSTSSHKYIDLHRNMSVSLCIVLASQKKIVFCIDSKSPIYFDLLRNNIGILLPTPLWYYQGGYK